MMYSLMPMPSCQVSITINKINCNQTGRLNSTFSGKKVTLAPDCKWSLSKFQLGKGHVDVKACFLMSSLISCLVSYNLTSE